MNRPYYEAYDWQGGIPRKIEGVCCDTITYDKIVVPGICLYTCTGCGKHYSQPKTNFLKVRGNPELDATAGGDRQC